MDARATAAALALRVPAIVELTRRLVEIESPTESREGVEGVCRTVADALVGSGCDIRWRPVADSGPLLDATLDLGTGPSVLVLGHADTVWPVGTLATWPFRHDAGWLTGPGVGDMKCSLATAVEAIAFLARERPSGLGGVRLMVVPDEERGSIGSRPLIEAAAREAAACLTLEAARPGGGVVVARGAVGAMRIEASGHARHVADPGPAASALRPLAALVAPIEGLGADGATASVGVLRAGTARQVVPGAGELLVDLRGATSAVVVGLADAVRELVASVPRPPGVELFVEGGLTRPAWPAEPGGRALLSEACAIARGLGVQLHGLVEKGGSDASFAGALGVPTLDGLGPECRASCSREERVPEAAIVPWATLLTCLIPRAASGCGERRASSV